MLSAPTTETTTLVRVRRLGLVLAWMVFIFALSSVQDPAVPSGMATPGHAVLYFVLGALLLEALRAETVPARALALAVILASLYGASDEVHQAFVPTRMPEILDWAWDTIGAAAGSLTWGYARFVLARRHR